MHEKRQKNAHVLQGWQNELMWQHYKVALEGVPDHATNHGFCMHKGVMIKQAKQAGAEC